MARGLDAGKYFWRSGREKCFSLDIPFYRTSGPFRWESALLRASTEGATQLLQLCILGFGLLEDRDVRVGVFPEQKEILIGRSCLGVITR
jgi:hypothetical protein